MTPQTNALADAGPGGGGGGGGGGDARPANRGSGEGRKVRGDVVGSAVQRFHQGMGRSRDVNSTAWSKSLLERFAFCFFISNIVTFSLIFKWFSCQGFGRKFERKSNTPHYGGAHVCRR